jgi:hypothetical protein
MTFYKRQNDTDSKKKKSVVARDLREGREE